jgi:hypothetical protein
MRQPDENPTASDNAVIAVYNNHTEAEEAQAEAFAA